MKFRYNFFESTFPIFTTIMYVCVMMVFPFVFRSPEIVLVFFTLYVRMYVSAYDSVQTVFSIELNLLGIDHCQKNCLDYRRN